MFSVMAVFAPPAQAHNGTVSWGCDGWTVDLNNYRGATVQITVDGQTVANTSFKSEYDDSGIWDDTASHTLQVVVDASDDNDQPVYNLGSNSSFSPDWQDGEWSFTLNVSQDACTQPQPEEVSVTVGGVCVVQEGVGVGQISVDISVDDGASVDVSDSDGVIDTLTQSGTITVAEDASYSWSASALPGFALTGSTSGTIDIEECTPPPAVGAAVTVGIASDCVVSDDLGQGVIDVTISIADGATVVITDSNGATMGTLTQSGSITVPENAVYNWTATAANGFEFPPGAETSGTISIAECTPVVGASILITVGGTCVLDGNDGSGLITVTVSVADGATVVVSDSDGGIVGTFSSDGSVTVPEGATYSWLATANDGFEFPAGFDSSGTVTIETCSIATVLPFTGIFADRLATLGFILLASGVVVMTGGWYLFGWNEES
jgi:hypothetical protein